MKILHEQEQGRSTRLILTEEDIDNQHGGGGGLEIEIQGYQGNPVESEPNRSSSRSGMGKSRFTFGTTPQDPLTFVIKKEEIWVNVYAITRNYGGPEEEAGTTTSTIPSRPSR